MIYLFASIFCSSLIALIFKISESKNLNRYAVTSFNYVTAVIVSFFISLNKGLIGDINIYAFKSLKNEFFNVFISNNGLFSSQASVAWAICVGLTTGIFFCLTLVQLQKSIRINGLGLSNTFNKMGIIIPVTISLIIWNEIPSLNQLIGIILAFAAIIIVNIKFDENILSHIKVNLILLFIYGGISGFSSKLYQKYALIEYKDLFLVFVFSSALMMSIYYTFKSKKKVTKYDVATGVLVGIPNLFIFFFMVLALKHVITSIAYIISSAGSIVLVLMYSILIFREKLVKKEIVAILMIITALIIIYI